MSKKKLLSKFYFSYLLLIVIFIIIFPLISRAETNPSDKPICCCYQKVLASGEQMEESCGIIMAQECPKGAVKIEPSDPDYQKKCFAEEINLPLEVPIGKMKVASTLGHYIGAIYQWSIAALSILAVVMIMVGGIQWIIAGGDASQISRAKSTITNSIFGLLIALSSYLILKTINPDLLKLTLPPLPKILKIEMEPADPPAPDYFSFKKAHSIGCTRIVNSLCDWDPDGTKKLADRVVKVAELFKDSGVDYYWGAKMGWCCYQNQNECSQKRWIDPKSTDECRKGPVASKKNGNSPFCLDCSGFVSLVYNCALDTHIHDLNVPVSTKEMKNWSGNNLFEKVDDFSEIEEGDFFGWNIGGSGHVFIYLGGKKIIEAKGGCPPDNAKVKKSSLKGGNYEKIYKYKKGDPNPGFFFFHLKDEVRDRPYQNIYREAPPDCSSS